MKVGIVTNPNVEKSREIGQKISSNLTNDKIENKILDIDNLENNYDFVLAIGGDGTMLKTARHFSKTKTPVMGVNLGRLGFLSLIKPTEIDNLSEIIKNKEYETQERIMLEANNVKALNDFVIKGCSCNRTAKFELHINNEQVFNCIADGLVISTPTGSTAYGLSAGGPVLSPCLNCVVIVPICAHTMTVRPIVIPDTEKITIKCENMSASADGQQTISNLEELTISKSEDSAILAFPKNEFFYSILKNKLYWGASALNS